MSAKRRAQAGGALFVELGAGAQQPRVGEVHHGVELVQVVLDGRAGEQDAAAAGQRVQGLVGQGLVVLQPVRLVADEQVTRAGAREPLLGCGQEGVS